VIDLHSFELPEKPPQHPLAVMKPMELMDVLGGLCLNFVTKNDSEIQFINQWRHQTPQS